VINVAANYMGYLVEVIKGVVCMYKIKHGSLIALLESDEQSLPTVWGICLKSFTILYACTKLSIAVASSHDTDTKIPMHNG